MSDAYDRAMADVFRDVQSMISRGVTTLYPTVVNQWYLNKVEMFRQCGNPNPYEAVKREYNLWPNQSTDSAQQANVVTVKGGNTAGLQGCEESRDFISALRAASSSTAPNTTLSGALYSTFAKSSGRGGWNFEWKVSINDGNPARVLDNFIRWLDANLPGYTINHIQQHNIGEGYWKVSARVPV